MENLQAFLLLYSSQYTEGFNPLHPLRLHKQVLLPLHSFLLFNVVQLTLLVGLIVTMAVGIGPGTRSVGFSVGVGSVGFSVGVVGFSVGVGSVGFSVGVVGFSVGVGSVGFSVGVATGAGGSVATKAAHVVSVQPTTQYLGKVSLQLHSSA